MFTKIIFLCLGKIAPGTWLEKFHVAEAHNGLLEGLKITQECGLVMVSKHSLRVRF